ncbi:protein EVI2A [Bufo gargarizans]|uniref:protein EVI2A n=1 Tax=Bufo gargarizans TaxID=30331 RepID=UPI001CF2911A|nr:protein EVI2A [Bufo gargarizans]
MKNMQPSLHLVMLFLSFSCKAEVSMANFNTDKPVITEINSTSDAPVHFLSLHEDNSTTSVYEIAPELRGQDVTTNKPNRTTVSYNVTQQTTSKETKGLKSNYTVIPHNPNITATATCTVDEKYKTGIIICVIVIAVLVFIIAVLIISTVVLANKVSALKAKLTQSKRQARSNGDFLSASSILWPLGMETWQKKAHEANLTMDEISLGDTNTIEKLKLMATPTLARSREDTEENKSLTTATMTTISTLEV